MLRSLGTQAFACDTLEEEGETYLRADYSLKCDTPAHKWYKGYAGVMILVSAFFYPASRRFRCGVKGGLRCW